MGLKTLRDPDAILAGGLAALRAQFQVPEGFPPDVEAAAGAAARRPLDAHTDRTALPFVTLDPASATDLDQAFESAGLGTPQVPGFPRLQVLWSTDATPQPFAVVIESSEELVRERLAPQLAVPTPNPDPSHHYWKVGPFPWLDVEASATPPAAGELPAAPVDRIAVGPGGTRVIVFLGAAARGTRLKLDLVSTPVPGAASTRTPLLSVGLVAAPWEDED